MSFRLVILGGLLFAGTIPCAGDPPLPTIVPLLRAVDLNRGE